MDNRKIVVITDLTIQKRKDGKMFAAHMDVLGLTAYGRTAESARENLTQCYSRWVHLHRRGRHSAQKTERAGSQMAMARRI